MSGANKNILKFFVGTFVLFLFLGILNFANAGVRNTFFSFSQPIQKFFWQTSQAMSFSFGSVLNGASYFKENQNLKDENQKLLSQVANLQAIVAGNQALTQVSESCQSDEFKLEMAGIVGAAKDTITINKGSASGLEVGMPVIMGQKVLAGKISKVYNNFSEVMLISNKSSIINVKVLNSESVNGVVKGQGGLSILLDLVSVDDVLNQNEILVTSALEGTFPKGLLVGQILQVQKNDQNPHQQAELKPFFNINTDNVFVITNYKK